MGNKPHVLIVDDDASVLRTMALILERKGYAVTTAGDGPTALEKVEQRPYDIIFMDIQMPLMDGVETYRKIKEIRPDAAAMMMTAYAVEDLVQQALQEGAYGVLHKPLDMDRVIAIIDGAGADKQGALILVVDDDPSTCVMLQNILTRRGHGVGVAHSGEEAVTAARDPAYDIIFVDMKMPVLNGLETYMALRAVDPEVVVIAMTGYRQEMASLVDEVLANHAYTCLYKPFDIDRLLTLVDEIWESKQRRGHQG